MYEREIKVFIKKKSIKNTNRKELGIKISLTFGIELISISDSIYMTEFEVWNFKYKSNFKDIEIGEGYLEYVDLLEKIYSFFIVIKKKGA